MKWLASLLLLALPFAGMAEQMTAYPPGPKPTSATTQNDALSSVVETLATCQDTLKVAVDQNGATGAVIRNCESRLIRSEAERARVQKEFEGALTREDEILREAQKLSSQLAHLRRVKVELSRRVTILERALLAERVERATWAEPRELVMYLPRAVIDRLGNVKVPVTRNVFGVVTTVTLSSDLCRGAPLRCKGYGFGSDSEFVNVFNQVNPNMVHRGVYRRGDWVIPVCRTNRAFGAVPEARTSEQVAQVPKANVQATNREPAHKPTALGSEKIAKNVAKANTAKPAASKPAPRAVAKANTRKQDLRNWAREECAKSPTCARTMTAGTKPAKPVQPVANKQVDRPATMQVAQKASSRPVVATTGQEAVRVLTEKSGTTVSPSNVTGGCNTAKIQQDSKCWAGVKGTSAKVELTPKAAKEISAALSKAQKASI